MSTLGQGVANRLKYLRKRHKLSQADVAEVISCTGSHISNVENLKAELTLSEMEKLADFFKKKSLYLIAGVTDDLTEIFEQIAKMDPTKRKLAIRLFELNLEMMEISKNWPSDAENKV